mmetsp:Transcript_8788/g.12285  ORF Transcript_8788/g.12285 Transcript_8788/m.12285 type:complete len:201 (-) Transcript_8788:1145-1747(-)
MAGKSSTSLMLFLSERNIVMRSTPQPQPPVGGSPYSSAVQKSSSSTWASSSPAAAWRACSANRSRCTAGLFSSVYALHTSRWQMKSSKRSVSPGLLRWYLASGDISSGWSMMKVGLVMLSSRKWPTSLSSRRAAERGSGHRTSCCSQRALSVGAKAGSPSAGSVTPMASSRPSIMLMRLKGGVKSMVTGSAPGSGVYWMT